MWAQVSNRLYLDFVRLFAATLLHFVPESRWHLHSFACNKLSATRHWHFWINAAASSIWGRTRTSQVSLLRLLCRAFRARTCEFFSACLLLGKASTRPLATEWRLQSCVRHDPHRSVHFTFWSTHVPYHVCSSGCVKHFTGNEIEDDRTGMNSMIDEKTWLEMYSRPFQAAIDAGVVSCCDCGSVRRRDAV